MATVAAPTSVARAATPLPEPLDMMALQLARLRERLAANPRAIRVAGALFAGLLAVVIIVLGYSDSDCLRHQNDDTYITYRYARNLATGHGLVFNVGDSTDAASSFSFTVLLALCHLLGMHDLPVVSCAIGLFAAGVTCALVFLGCLDRTGRPVVSMALSLAMALHGLLSGWAISGMDTLFFTALVTLALYRLCLRRTFGWLEAGLVALLSLTRFEGLLVGGVWAVLGSLRFLRGDLTVRRRLLTQLAVVAGVLALFVVFKWFTYGALLPDSFRLKRITALYAPRPKALWEVWSHSSAALLMLALGGLTRLQRRVEDASLVGYFFLSLLSVVLGPFSDWARYSVHLLPIIVWLAGLAVSALLDTMPLLALGSGVLVVAQSCSSFDDVKVSMCMAASEQVCRQQIGEFLERNLDPDSVVLSSDIGAIAYAAPSITFVDAVGLTSRDVLSARLRGENADALLFRKHPLIIADSCSGSCAVPSRFSAFYWLSDPSKWSTPLPAAQYPLRLESGELLARCRSTDGLSIGAARFRLGGVPQPP